MAERPFTLRLARWNIDAPALRALRTAVFIEEQGVPEALEWDGLDSSCTHVIAEHAGEAIGTARLLSTGQIGRMAVLVRWRHRGVGSALLERLIQHALTLEFSELWLHAQTHAVPFYMKFGFNAQGGEFLEAGIPHTRMIKRLAP